ncbi:MAG: tRNA 2-selenouridine(34) synthase MnmH [Bacteroidia bacterium]
MPNIKTLIERLSITEFLQRQQAEGLPVADVRSPGEFRQGHIPGAENIALFDDEERKTVGILYKQTGREAAVMKGLELVGPKMADLARSAQTLAVGQELLVHCWRGGMRSESMAWLWSTAGLRVGVLQGGYKAFRNHLLATLATPLRLVVLGGKTGSGKTHILHALRAQGEQIIDLEAIAHHKGSSFGAIGEAPQPTVEQFENDLYAALRQLDPSLPIWVEDESHAIGRVFIPQPLWQQMRQAPVVALDIPEDLRLDRLVQDYASGDWDTELEAALLRIGRRLGGQALQSALDALHRRDYAGTARIALHYYDKTYSYGLEQRPAHLRHTLAFDTWVPDQLATALISFRINQLSDL